jgi:RHS repeat-associated protein
VAGVRNTNESGNEDCSGSPGPDGVSATESRMCPQTDLVVAPDGTIYFPETAGNRVRRIGPDGIVTTVAGTGEFCFSFGSVCGDGGPAVAADLSGVNALALGVDGSLYLVSGNSIRRVGVDGIITTVAGKTGQNGFSGDGGPAVDARVNNPRGLVVTRDGTIFFTDSGNERLRMIDQAGIIRTLSGTGETCFSGQDCNSGDGGPALQARLREPSSLELGPDGGLYLITNPVINQERRMRRIGAALPGFSDGDLAIPSTDGGQVYQFDATGRHLRTLHALTRAVLLDFEYDTAGRLVRAVQRTGGTDNVTTVGRDAGGKPTAIVGPFGDETTLDVDADGFLSEITNPAGESRSFTYAAGGLLATYTDARDNVDTYTFGDEDDRLERGADPAGGHQDLARVDTASGFEVTRTTKLGLTTTYGVESPAEGTTERTVTAPDGTASSGVSVADAATATVTHADGTVSRQVSGPDPRFDMQAPIASELRVTLPSAAELLTTATRAVTLADPDDPLSLVSQTDLITVAGATTTVAWSTASRTFTLTSPEGRTRAITLDALGRTTGITGPGIAPSVVTYDARGRVAEVTAGTGPAARTIAFDYDSSGRVASITDPVGRTVGFTYDAAGRRLATTRPDAAEVAFAWDATSNLVGLTPPGRPTHVFGYDARDALVSVTSPAVTGGGPAVYATDDDGRLTTVTRPDGDVVTLTYDGGGRLASRVVSQGAIPVATQTTSYDAAGRVATVTAPNGIAVSYAYDGPLLLSETWAGDVAGTVSRTWDPTARPVSEAVNGDAVALAYDGDGFLTAAGDLTITRDPDTGLPTATAIGVVTDATSYDLFGGSLTHAADAGATPLYAASYVRDALGRQRERHETVGADPERVLAYEYDPLGRLTEVRQGGVVIEEYSYDANGNRTSATVGGVTRAGTYDDQDRLVAYGTASYDFDANGRLAERTTPAGTTTYGYDPLGGLAEVALPGGDTVSYLTDGQGRRVAKLVNGTPVQGFLYAGPLRPVAELDGSGAVVRRFVYAGGAVPVYMVAGGDAFRFVTDEVGSVRLVVNTATGAVAQRLDYDSFGNVTADTSPGFQPFGFAGGLYDRDTDLVRFGARDYDPETGRFTTRDPIGFAGGSTNLYAYAGSDPVNGNDPLGLEGWDWGSFAAGALVGVAEALVGVVDLVTGGAVSATGRNIWGGVDAILDLMGYNYDGALDLAIDALDLEATVNKDGLEFFAGELCGLIGGGAATGGAGVAGAGRGALQGAGAGAERALASAATQAVARGSRAPGLQVVSAREAELAIARQIDDAAAAAERAAGQQAGRAAEEGGLWLVKSEQRGGGVAKPKPQSGLSDANDL